MVRQIAFQRRFKFVPERLRLADEDQMSENLPFRSVDDRLRDSFAERTRIDAIVRRVVAKHNFPFVSGTGNTQKPIASDQPIGLERVAHPTRFERVASTFGG